MAPKRAVIAAGGTGGHFYPGLVLAKTLRERGWEPVMLVKKGDPALATLEKEGIAACEIDLGGLPRKPGLALLAFWPRLFRSLMRLRLILLDFQPSVVAGMGGYLTFPAVAAAAASRVPRVLHESNAVLGLANKASAALGAELYWGLPPLKDRGPVCGTPIRPALWTRQDNVAAAKALGLDPALPTVLVFGGSQGARGVNRHAPTAVAAVAKKLGGRLQVLHLSGPKEADNVAAAYKLAGVKAVVKPYLETMELAYGAADLVVCRSGASTLAELAAQRKPAVLIPYPTAAAGHQEDNARVFERAGAAAVVLERDDLPARLAEILDELLASPQAADRRLRMAQAYAGLGLPEPAQAAQRLADAVERAAKGKTVTAGNG